VLSPFSLQMPQRCQAGGARVLLAVAIFLVTYALIVSERVNKTVAALAGGLLMILAGVLTQEEAFGAIDLNVIFLLAGMMIIANVLAESGAFEWLALKAVRLARGKPVRLLVLFGLLTAIVSAFLDNVTAVVLIAPVTLYVARELGVSAKPYLLLEVFASNIGGTATLIGDPPNILIGSAAGLSFTDFLVHAAPVALLILVVLLGGIPLAVHRGIQATPERLRAVLTIDPSSRITDYRLLAVGSVVLVLTLLGFLLHGPLGLESGTIALTGAATLLLVGSINVNKSLQDVEWETLFFFVGLFMAVAGLEHTGALAAVGHALTSLTGGDLRATVLLVLWVSVLLSGIVDNIPYATAMIPVVREMSQTMGISNGAANPLWWALVLGADLGGNLTVVAASANVIVVGIARREGIEIGFWDFLKYGAPITFGSVLIATAYVWLRYLG
jgi:Na+/H+ antiporter NhaD/arsenite permease-like protein